MRFIDRNLIRLVIPAYTAAILAILHGLNNQLDRYTTLLIVFLAIVFAGFLHLGLARRMSPLASTLRNFDRGDWNSRSCIDGNDALAQISQTLDKVLESVTTDREQLRHSEARIKAVLETATEGIINIDADGGIQSMNSAAEKIFGYAKNDVIGKNVSILMPEPYRSKHDSYIQNYLSSGQAKIIGIGREVLGRRSDGSVFPMELAVSEVEFVDERSFTGIVRDISKRKRAEQLLKASEEQLRRAIESAPIGIVTCDLDSTILSMNPACAKTTGFDQSELVSENFSRLLHPADRPEFRKFAQQAKLGQLRASHIHQRWLHKGGSVLSGVLHIGLIRDDQGFPDRFVMQMEDHTDRLNAEAEARQLREKIAHVARINTLGEMVAGIAHEINQPLAAIANYADGCQRLLTAENLPRQELLGAMQQTSTQAHRAAEVIKRLRGFAKMQSVTEDNVDINALIKDVVALATMENPALKSIISLSPGNDVPTIQCDKIQVQQVILNLIRNATESMQEAETPDPELVIQSALKDSNTVSIDVRDCGPGIQEATVSRIFDPFYSTKSSGIGLGLSICKSIVTEHGGSLEAQNNIGRGAVFKLTLPIRRD